MKTYGTMYDEFKTDRGTDYTLYYALFFLRRTVYICNLIMLRDYVGA